MLRLPCIVQCGIKNVATFYFVVADNYYTSFTAAENLYEFYHWLFVGTYKLTKKDGRGEDDFQFHKLSNGAMKSIPRGWSRRATREFDLTVILKNISSSALCGRTANRLPFFTHIKFVPMTAISLSCDVKRGRSNVWSCNVLRFSRIMPTISMASIYKTKTVQTTLRHSRLTAGTCGSSSGALIMSFLGYGLL